jgi:hypothetical protein
MLLLCSQKLLNTNLPVLKTKILTYKPKTFSLCHILELIRTLYDHNNNMLDI